MSDDKPDTATAPTDEPKAETPAEEAHAQAPDATASPAAAPEAETAAGAVSEVAPEAPAEPQGAVPEAAAGVAEETAPEAGRAPEPEPAPPPEVAEVAAAVAQLDEQQGAARPPAEPEAATTEALVPVQEPVSEAPVPVPEEPPATEPVAAEPATEEPQAEAPVAEPQAEVEEPQAETTEEPKAKPKRSKATKTKAAKAAPAAAPDATAEPAEEPTGTVAGAEEPTEAKPESKKKWYAVKVQSGREDTIKAAILRKVAIEGLEDYFGEIAIPTEEVIEEKPVRKKDKKTGEYTYEKKKVTKKKKKFHGYLFANVEFNDRILYLFRETSGVGDFLNVRGSPGNPIAEPMPEHEVRAMLTGERVADPNRPRKVKIDFEKGDKVRVREGSFANFEGEVKAIIESKDPNEAPKVSVELTFWGRPSIVEFDSGQVEKV